MRRMEGGRQWSEGSRSLLIKGERLPAEVVGAEKEEEGCGEQTEGERERVGKRR